MAKATLKLSEPQIRALLFCLDNGQMDLEQHTAEERGASEMQHFERSIEAMFNQLSAQGFSL
jgi:hypothetical protein